MKTATALLIISLFRISVAYSAEELQITAARMECGADKSCDITIEVLSRLNQTNALVEYSCDIAIDYSLQSSPVSRTVILTKSYGFPNRTGQASDSQTFNWRPLGFPMDLRRAALGKVDCRTLRITNRN